MHLFTMVYKCFAEYFIQVPLLFENTDYLFILSPNDVFCLCWSVGYWSLRISTTRPLKSSPNKSLILLFKMPLRIKIFYLINYSKNPSKLLNKVNLIGWNKWIQPSCWNKVIKFLSVWFFFLKHPVQFRYFGISKEFIYLINGAIFWFLHWILKINSNIYLFRFII